MDLSELWAWGCSPVRPMVNTSLTISLLSGGARVYGARGQGSYPPVQTSDSSDTIGVARFVKRGKRACASLHHFSSFHELMQSCGVRRPSVCPSVNFCANRFFYHRSGWIATKLAHDAWSPEEPASSLCSRSRTRSKVT